jgi:hypothetical protein
MINHNYPTHSTKSIGWYGVKNLTCDLHMERETLHVFFFLSFCIRHKCSMCPRFVTWQNSSWYSIFAHSCCSMSRSVSEKALMILRISGRTCCTGGRKTGKVFQLSYVYCQGSTTPCIRLDWTASHWRHD